jgi:hypothetical protein
MKIFAKKDKRTDIDKEIQDLIKVMNVTDKTSEGYLKLAEAYDTLMKGRSNYKDNTKVSKDVIVTCGVAVLQLVIVVGYEHAHVLVSKGMGLIIKGRV